jgi:hypothetical protein
MFNVKELFSNPWKQSEGKSSPLKQSVISTFLNMMLKSHQTSEDEKQTARRAIKSFLGVQGAIFQKSPLAAGGIKSNVIRY